MSSFSKPKARLPKQMIAAHTSVPPNDKHAFNCKAPPIAIPKVNSSASSSRISPPNTSDENPKEVFTVHDEPAVDTEMQMSRHTLVQNKDNKRLAQEWRNQVKIPKSYYAYRDEFMDMQTKFQSM